MCKTSYKQPFTTRYLSLADTKWAKSGVCLRRFPEQRPSLLHWYQSIAPHTIGTSGRTRTVFHSQDRWDGICQGPKQMPCQWETLIQRAVLFIRKIKSPQMTTYTDIFLVSICRDGSTLTELHQSYITLYNSLFLRSRSLQRINQRLTWWSLKWAAMEWRKEERKKVKDIERKVKFSQVKKMFKRTVYASEQLQW